MSDKREIERLQEVIKRREEEKEVMESMDNEVKSMFSAIPDEGKTLSTMPDRNTVWGTRTQDPQKTEATTKDTNPKDAVGVKKAPISTVSGAVMAEVGLGMLEGARKYGRHNYRESGVRASVYHDATWRHMLAWWDFGQDLDPDSGLSHITKAIASLMVLRDAMMMDNWVDDRPPPLPIELLAKFNEMAGAIVEKYPNAKDPVTNESFRKK